MAFIYKTIASMEALQKVDDLRWVGFDLDGTVAQYDEWKGWDHIGEPVPAMVKIIKDLLAKGITCKILTARASDVSLARSKITFQQLEKVIQDWTEKHIGTRLPVTSQKDCYMITCYDDKIVQVEMNTGKIIGKDITMEEYNKEAIQTKKDPNQVDLSEATHNYEWNTQQIEQKEIDAFMSGLVSGGFATASYPESWTSDTQWLVDAESDNTKIRVAINTLPATLKNSGKQMLVVCDVQIVNGSQRLAFALEKNLDFKCMGEIIARSSLSKVVVKM